MTGDIKSTFPGQSKENIGLFRVLIETLAHVSFSRIHQYFPTFLLIYDAEEEKVFCDKKEFENYGEEYKKLSNIKFLKVLIDIPKNGLEKKRFFSIESIKYHTFAVCHCSPRDLHIIVGFPKEIVESCYRFKDKKGSEVSFLNSLVAWFFHLSTQVFPYFGGYVTLIHRSAELLRRAAFFLINDCIVSGDVGLDFFEQFNEIAQLKYEGKVVSGKITFVPEEFERITFSLRLKEEVLISDHKKVRKLLEICNFDKQLIANGKKIIGLGKISDTLPDDSIFQVVFSKSPQWQFLHNGNVVFEVEKLLPKLFQEKVRKQEIINSMKRTFSRIRSNGIEYFCSVLEQATKQEKGTIIVIVEKASKEAKRLMAQSLLVEPQKLEVGDISQISSIDGAILFSPDGKCHAIGVILDGIVPENIDVKRKGDSSRGARYNSALRYFNWMKEIKNPCFILVVSEDGHVNKISD